MRVRHLLPLLFGVLLFLCRGQETWNLTLEISNGMKLPPENIRILSPAQGGQILNQQPLDRQHPVLYLHLPDKTEAVRIEYQCCSETECALPVTQVFNKGQVRATESNLPAPALALKQEAGRFYGYKSPKQFLQWLRAPQREQESLPSRLLKEYGALLSLIVVFLLGTLLNLTPCVLPMLPISLAILGIRKEVSRITRLCHSLWYALGITCAIGCAALPAILAGRTMGTLQETWWFQALIALLFLLLAAAQFDLISLDFSRFRKRQAPTKTFSAVKLFFTGALAALLASACVAPILIGTILTATQLSANGRTVLACLLPFVLGAGMSLPWVVLGQLLSWIPRPGAWMTHVKRLLALLLLGCAVFYGIQCWRLIAPSTSQNSVASTTSTSSKKATLLIFGGPACRACTLFKEKTLSSPEVQEIFVNYEIYFYSLDNPSDLNTAQGYGVRGIPCVILLADKTNSP